MLHLASAARDRNNKVHVFWLSDKHANKQTMAKSTSWVEILILANGGGANNLQPILRTPRFCLLEGPCQRKCHKSKSSLQTQKLKCSRRKPEKLLSEQQNKCFLQETGWLTCSHIWGRTCKLTFKPLLCFWCSCWCNYYAQEGEPKVSTCFLPNTYFLG